MKIEIGKYYRTRDGRKIGPMARAYDGEYYRQERGAWHYNSNGKCCYLGKTGKAVNPNLDLIAEWTEAPTGPVRTVTRKEIVPGVYGRVRVEGASNGEVLINLTLRNGLRHTNDYYFNATELRAAIATLTEIADALEGGAK